MHTSARDNALTRRSRQCRNRSTRLSRYCSGARGARVNGYAPCFIDAALAANRPTNGRSQRRHSRCNVATAILYDGAGSNGRSLRRYRCTGRFVYRSPRTIVLSVEPSSALSVSCIGDQFRRLGGETIRSLKTIG